MGREEGRERERKERKEGKKEREREKQEGGEALNTSLQKKGPEGRQEMAENKKATALTPRTVVRTPFPGLCLWDRPPDGSPFPDGETKARGGGVLCPRSLHQEEQRWDSSPEPLPAKKEKGRQGEMEIHTQGHSPCKERGHTRSGRCADA